ncbi:MAG: type I polyketide synthase [Cyanobacteria bacterium P01_A01_bin.40]
MSSNIESQKLLREAIAEMRHMRSRLTRFEQEKNESIAVIGMDCQFPGEASNPDAYWKILRDGVEGIVEIPRSRWDIDKYYDSNPNTSGKMYSRYGGFIENVDKFDPQFFGISPREAESIDPQQRLLLEVSYIALENSGECPARLRGSKTGVFIGQCFNDYSRLSINSSNLERIDALNCLGNSSSISAGRIAYVLGLQGPTLQLDTTCSSSLVAVHLACQSLRNKESNLAIAGGVNLMLSPEVTIGACSLQALSPDGRCKTFDAKADGYVRGEGCGVVVLKRLSDALADNNNILAVVRGSAVNHDGKSNGLTAPNGNAQEALIREALANARVKPEDVSYVEAHGTGTSLGDPIEVLALGNIFNGKRKNKLKIGSVKTNIGHLESAAGMASLIKVILSLQHKAIPPHLNYDCPNPHIPWKKLALEVCDRFVEWNDETRIAGVSSFGMSGTNAHLVVEQPPKISKESSLSDSDRPLHILALSAKNELALKQLSVKYLDRLTEHPNLAIGDICFSANTGRTHFPFRLHVLARSNEQLRQNLSALTSESKSAITSVQSGDRVIAESSKIAFMFTGQGSQYVGMARELYQTQPSFRQTIEQCDRILELYLEHSLLSVIYPNDGQSTPLHQTEYTQPALFAVEYALAKLWISWGIKPNVVIGHSLGEYVAATIAEVFSLEDALMLVAKRAKLMQALPPQGAMLAILANEKTVVRVIKHCSADVNIAAINSDENVVISGESETISLLATDLEAQNIKTRPLNVSHAFHSPLMQPMLEEFKKVAHQVSYSAPKLKIISNVIGNLADEKIATVEYWCSHIINPVQFKTGVETLESIGVNVLVEIGSKPTLLEIARSILSFNKKPRLWLPSLHPKQSDWQQMLESLSQLYLHGAEIDWQTFDRDYPRCRVQLPTYPFQRQRYWLEPTGNTSSKAELSNKNVNQSPAIDLLQQGKTDLLTQQLSKESDFSSDELKLLPKLLDILARQHQECLSTASIQNYFYQVEWQPKPFKSNSVERNREFEKPGLWLIFADRSGFGETLADTLREKSQDCFLIYEGETYQETSSRKFQINPSRLSDFERVYQKALQTKTLISGVIHLWSLNLPSSKDLAINSLEQAQTSVFNQVVNSAKIISKHQTSAPTRLWLITNGAVKIGSQTLNIAQSLVWGVGKAIALEDPSLWGGLIDLDPDISWQDNKDSLLTEIENGDSEKEQIAFRNKTRYVARLVRCSQADFEEVKLDPNATYLISGGLGSLGIKVAQWMVRKGVKHLVLTARKTPSTEAKKTLRDLENKGVKVLTISADISSIKDSQKLLKKIQDSMPALKGVIHAAGISGYQEIEQLELETFRAVLRPKVIGAWILHQLTKEMELDFLVTFSSVSSVWGSKGQAHYGAANCFLDAVAHYRHSLGLPALSINWGAWNDSGMLSKQSQALLDRRGLKALSSEEGLASLNNLINSNSIQATVANVDWELFKSIYELTGLRSLLEQIETRSPRIVSDKTEQHQILQQLEQTAIENRHEVLVSYLQTEIARILKIKNPQAIDPARGFFELGMDSLMAVELKNSLETAFNYSIPTTIAFETPTIINLADYIGKEVCKWNLSECQGDAEASLSNQNRHSDPLKEVARLTEDEIQNSIAEKLKKLESLTRGK